MRPDARLQITGRKTSVHIPSCVELCTLTPKICQYYHLPLTRATTIPVHVEESVPEIMDTIHLPYFAFMTH
jgi:hypothetical protein